MTSLLYDFTIVSRSGNSDQSNSSNFTFKNFSGGACPRTLLGGCASGARVLRSHFTMLHSDPVPINSLRGPGNMEFFFIYLSIFTFFKHAL